MRVKLLAVARQSSSSFCRYYIVKVFICIFCMVRFFVCAEHLSMLQELLARAYKWSLTAAALCYFCLQVWLSVVYWTTRGYANSRIANSRTGRLADWTTRGCHRRLCVLSFPFWRHQRDRELSSPRVGNPRVGVSASCPITVYSCDLFVMCVLNILACSKNF